MAKRKKNTQRGQAAPIVDATNAALQRYSQSSILTLDGRQLPIKSTGNPYLDRFMGISGAEPYNYEATPDGLKQAFLASVWAMRCIALKANTIGGLPLRFLDGNDEDLPKDHPLPRAFSPGRRSSTILRRVTQHVNVYGAAYVIRRARRPLRLFALNPETIETEFDITGVVGFYQRIDGQLVDAWSPDELVYIHDYDPDNDLSGLSPTAWLLRTIGLDASLEQFAKTFFENDATPAGLLTTEQSLQPTDAERIRAGWERNFKGVDNAHRTAVLGQGTTFQTITPPMKDLALTELDDKVMRRIAGAYGVPMTLVGMSEAANYATIKEQRGIFYTETILPELDLYLDAFNEQLCIYFGDGIHIVPDVDNVEALQEDRTEVTTRAASGFAAGYRSFNESREMDGLEPLKSDFFVVPSIGLVSRADLEAGKLPEPPAPQNPFAFPAFGGGATQSTTVDEQADHKARYVKLSELLETYLNSTRAQQEPVTKAIPTTALPPAVNVMSDLYAQDLTRWERKALKRGATVAFSPDYLPSVYADFIRMDLATGQKSIRDVFADAGAALKAVDATMPTPEEFSAYWQGIGGLYDELALAAMAGLQQFNIADMIRSGSDDTATAEAQLQILLQDVLVKIYLAGAARGNDLLQTPSASANPAKAVTDPSAIAWDVISTQAATWARNYAAQQVRYIGATTQQAIRDATAQWVQSGGALSELADLIEGKLDPADMTIPQGFSPAKLQWLTSPERAALIAQTESTETFHFGVQERWKSAGVQRMRFRTQNDGIVCPVCAGLNNVIGEIGVGFPTDDGIVQIPVHVGCRCFSSPAPD